MRHIFWSILLATSACAQATQVELFTYPLGYQTPKRIAKVCKNFELNSDNQLKDGDLPCPNINIYLAKTTPKFIGEAINREISDGNADEFIKGVRHFAEESYQEWKGSDKSAAYIYAKDWFIKPKKIAPFGVLSQFAIDEEIYAGGAHGVYSTRYLAFDMGLGRQIFVKDIAIDSAKLRRLAYADYLRQKGIDPLVQYAEFELGDNFYFDKKGIHFVYAPYVLGSYAEGEIELSVPFAKLKGVLKGRYLR